MSDHLVVDNLAKSYGTAHGPAVIVRNFNLHIKKGEFVTLIGHSGCGKSTVLSMIAGLNSISEGVIILAGKELVGPGPDRGVVFQSPCLLPWLTAYENVRLGVDQAFYTASREERHQIVEYYLTIVGLAESMHRRPSELSQGMRQRVGVARAFALAPRMLLLDEPFGMLDTLTRFELQEVLLALWRRNSLTTLMVTHDVDEALFLSDRVVCMTDGPAAEVGEILQVPFPRPRERARLLEDPLYYELRAQLMSFLGDRAHRRPKDEPATPRKSGANQGRPGRSGDKSSAGFEKVLPAPGADGPSAFLPESAQPVPEDAPDETCLEPTRRLFKTPRMYPGQVDKLPSAL